VAFGLEDLNDEVQLRRKAVLTPCSSKEGLRRWFRMYLGLDFPDQVIDSESTGSPMDTFWEIYDAAVRRDVNFARRILVYASRDSFKTLGAAALELLAMLHMLRSGVHLAAIEQQAGKSQEYLRAFLDNEDLNEFKVGDNKRTIAVCWFEHKQTGNILTLDEWKSLGGRKTAGQYWRHSYYIKVLVNTAQSANSDHTAWMVVDEADLIRFPKAYQESILIPSTQTDVYGNKQPPVTIVTSTRKSSGGLVQAEIDRAEKTGMAIRHWNILDVTKRCPNERHRPDLPKLKVMRSDVDLRCVTPDEFVAMQATDPKRAQTYVEDSAYAGCVTNCPIFAACRGRLAEQQSTAGLLKEVEDTIGKFKEVSGEMAKAQLLCWKPGNEGAIYSQFSRQKHMLSANEMWEAVTGEPAGFPVTKEALVALFRSRSCPVFTGMDFGFSHMFAVVTGYVDGRRLFVIDAFEVPGLEPNQCVEVCDRRIKAWGPVVWPDIAYPAYVKMFRSSGYQIRSTTDKDVLGGIESVRMKLMPAGGREPEVFLLKDDDGCETLAKRVEGYKWKMDSAGRATDVPDDTDDDSCDAFRYLIHNVFRKDGRVVVSNEAVVTAKTIVPQTQQQAIKQQMLAKIAELTGGLSTGAAVVTERRIKKGGLIADFS
jgi:hypothetical protein